MIRGETGRIQNIQIRQGDSPSETICRGSRFSKSRALSTKRMSATDDETRGWE